jgi:hypothetical protein
MNITNETLAQQRVQSGTAKVNGTLIFYETRGKGFPIVFVSGGGAEILAGRSGLVTHLGTLDCRVGL